MVEQTQSKVVREYAQYTDKYFSRSRQILEAEEINPIVRYQVFARKNIEKLVGVDEAVDFIKQATGDKVRVYALRDGQKYTSGEPLIKLEGRVQDSIDLETVYLGINSGRLTGPLNFQEIRQKARAIKQAAGNKPVYYFGARHFGYWDDEQIAKICQEEGFAGTSTDAGARAWDAKGMGTIPHALILSYQAHMRENGIKGNPTVEAMKGFDKHIDKAVPRLILVDTFNKECGDLIETATAVPSLAGYRIDTCGENHTQEAWGASFLQDPELESFLKDIKVPERYQKGKGVTITSSWVLRRAEDDGILQPLTQTVSSGFNAEKTAAFMQADKAYQERFEKPLFDSIGTGSIAHPVMTTSDIVAYFSEKRGIWVPNSKTGRDERETDRLEERK